MRQRIQKIGSFLSSMIMPVMAAFIAWGLIAAFFIPVGWFPNETLAAMTDPMIKYMLPLLIAYNGGKLVYQERGAVVGVIATMGIIVGSDIPMFLGAMLMAPFAGFLMKKVDQLLENRVKSGFEMLVNNYSAGILGFILAIFGLYLVGPIIEGLTNIFGLGVAFLIDKNLLFLTSVVIEPAKILFLNNAINHGVLTPLGTEQAQEFGKSILFLLEANPGPGLGILLAFSVFGKGVAKKTAPGAIVIQFFGGIHEIYFPYVMMKPSLFLAVILGGMSGVLTFSIFDAGLVAPASPGSIFALIAMSPKGGLFSVLLGIAVSTVVTFLVASFILKLDKEEITDEAFETSVSESKARKYKKADQEITSIKFACDAGMGSSAMGAGIMRKLVNDSGLNIEVTNCALKNLTSDDHFVITQKMFDDIAPDYAPNADIRYVDNFLDKTQYEAIIKEIKGE